MYYEYESIQMKVQQQRKIEREREKYDNFKIIVYFVLLAVIAIQSIIQMSFIMI